MTEFSFPIFVCVNEVGRLRALCVRELTHSQNKKYTIHGAPMWAVHLSATLTTQSTGHFNFRFVYALEELQKKKGWWFERNILAGWSTCAGTCKYFSFANKCLYLFIIYNVFFQMNASSSSHVLFISTKNIKRTLGTLGKLHDFVARVVAKEWMRSCINIYAIIIRFSFTENTALIMWFNCRKSRGSWHQHVRKLLLLATAMCWYKIKIHTLSMQTYYQRLVERCGVRHNLLPN